MVLLMHVLFVGAVFMLDSTLDRRIHEEPWYDSHLILPFMPSQSTNLGFPVDFYDALKHG
jgi:hypothetical protein